MQAHRLSHLRIVWEDHESTPPGAIPSVNVMWDRTDMVHDTVGIHHANVLVEAVVVNAIGDWATLPRKITTMVDVDATAPTAQLCKRNLCPQTH